MAVRKTRERFTAAMHNFIKGRESSYFIGEWLKNNRFPFTHTLIKEFVSRPENFGLSSLSSVNARAKVIDALETANHSYYAKLLAKLRRRD